MLHYCTDQIYGSASQTSWTDQFFFLKPWPIRIFEDLPFSLYFGAASESDEGLDRLAADHIQYF